MTSISSIAAMFPAQAAATAAASGSTAQAAATGYALKSYDTSAQASATKTQADLQKAAKSFEAIFVRKLIGSMREASLGDDDLTGSSAVDQFQEMADANTATGLAAKGGLGIAQLLLNQLGPKNLATAQAKAASTGATALSDAALQGNLKGSAT